MTPTTYRDWPFQPHDRRYREEQAAWWRTCRVTGPLDRRLAGSEGWTIISGGPGSGKSTALLGLVAATHDGGLQVEYPPTRWPGAAGARLPDDPRHLAQMITAAGWAIYELLEREPQRAAALGPLQRELFRALIERAGPEGRRQYDHLTRLFGDEEDAFRAVVVPDDMRQLAETRHELELQAKDVVWLARDLGLARVIFTFDLASDQPFDEASVAELYSGLDLLGSRDFIVVAAVPDRALARLRMVSTGRGRVDSVVCEWSEADCRRMAARHLCAALGHEPDDEAMGGFAHPQLLAAAGAAIAAEYGRPTPAGWVDLAETLLHLIHRPSGALRPPLGPDDAPALLSAFYARHFSLRLDPDPDVQGIWRGPRFIPLDDQPFRFIRLLVARRDTYINYGDDPDLRSLAGSSNNVNTLAARARKAIEPLARPYVYLLNDRGLGGYCLVNVDPASPTDTRQIGDRMTSRI